MYIGVPNPNILIPLAKMSIKNMDSGKEYKVLYNPASYTQERPLLQAKYAQQRRADDTVYERLRGDAAFRAVL